MSGSPLNAWLKALAVLLLLVLGAAGLLLSVCGVSAWSTPEATGVAWMLLLGLVILAASAWGFVRMVRGTLGPRALLALVLVVLGGVGLFLSLCSGGR